MPSARGGKCFFGCRAQLGAAAVFSHGGRHVFLGMPVPEGKKMRSFNLTVLGLDISFRAEADQRRVESAKALVEERFERLRFHGGRISKEALLTFLVLGLADDLLQSHDQLADGQNRIDALLTKIDDV